MRGPFRITVGDGFRFTFGAFLAAVVIFVLLCVVGMVLNAAMDAGRQQALFEQGREFIPSFGR